MALFSAYNIDWSEFSDAQLSSWTEEEVPQDKSIVSACFAITYTIEEELWLTEQVSVL
jgi:hypothetical protein